MLQHLECIDQCRLTRTILTIKPQYTGSELLSTIYQIQMTIFNILKILNLNIDQSNNRICHSRSSSSVCMFTITSIRKSINTSKTIGTICIVFCFKMSPLSILLPLKSSISVFI